MAIKVSASPHSILETHDQTPGIISRSNSSHPLLRQNPCQTRSIHTRSSIHSPEIRRNSSPGSFDLPSTTSYPPDLHQLPASRDAPGAFGKQPTQSTASFLSQHIPLQYAPQGERSIQSPPHADKSNTKYCYRHRPDLKCRRRADEPTMDQLQNELAALPQSDQEGISHVWSLFSAAPSKHRNLMLQGLLAQCCFPQLSFIAASIRELIKIDFLTALPEEIGLRILCYLDPTSICKAAQVSGKWRTLADDDLVWQKMCEQHIHRKCKNCGWGLPMLDRQRLRTAKRQSQLRARGPTGSESAEQQPGLSDLEIPRVSAREKTNGHKRPLEEGPLALRTDSIKRPCTSTRTADEESRESQPRLKPWKDVYRDRFRIGTNWKYGRCSIKTFRGHTNGVMCLQFDDNMLASGSYDSTIKLWNIENGQEVRTLTGHGLGVRCLQFDDTKLASGSLDGKVKIWNLHSGECVCTLPGHTAGVIGLHLAGALVASASADKTVRVWNFQERSAVVLRGHEDWVNAVKIDSASRTLFSTSDDGTIRLWDLDTKRTIRKFEKSTESEGHNGQVQQIVLLPPEFNCDGADKGGACWNDQGNDSPSLSYSDDANDQDNAKARPLPPRYMLTGGLDTTIRLWDVHRGVCVQTFFGHLEGIWALAADTLRVVSGANDGMVKIWDPCSGKCERTFTSHTGPVTCVGLNDRRMCTGSEDHEIKLYSFCS